MGMVTALWGPSEAPRGQSQLRGDVTAPWHWQWERLLITPTALLPQCPSCPHVPPVGWGQPGPPTSTRAGGWHSHTRVQGHLVPVPTHGDPPGPSGAAEAQTRLGGSQVLGGVGSGVSPALSHRSSGDLRQDTPSAGSSAATPPARHRKPLPPTPSSPGPHCCPPTLADADGDLWPSSHHGALGDQGPAAARGVHWAAPMSLGMLPAKATCCPQALGGSGHLTPPQPEPGTQHPSEHPSWGHLEPP